MKLRMMWLMAVLALVLGSATPLPATAQPDMRRPLDLAAMTLAPGDLDQPGFGLGFSAMLTLAEEALIQSDFIGRSRADVAEMLVILDWRRRYLSDLVLLTEPDDRTSAYQTVITTSIAEFDEPDGAADAFDFLADRSPVAPGELLTPPRTVGEHATLTRAELTSRGDDRSFTRLHLSFLIGNLIADVVIDGFGDQPRIEQAEALAVTLETKIAGVIDNGAVGLSSSALRLSGESIPRFRYDRYVHLNGDVIPLAGDGADLIVEQVRTRTGITDLYDIQFPVRLLDAPADAFYQLQLRRFVSPEAAAGFVGDPARLTGEGLTDVVPVAGGRSFGDQSLTISYGVSQDGAVTRGYRIVARVDDVVVNVSLDAAPGAPLPLVERLMDAQIACLAAPEVVCEPVPAPVSILTDLAAAARSADLPVTESQPSTEPEERRWPDVAATTYTSPSYGYTLTWDEAVWAVDETFSEDGYDRLILLSDWSTLYIEAIPDGSGNPESCLGANLALIQANDQFAEFAVLGGPGGDPLSGRQAGRAFAVYEFTFVEADGREVDNVVGIDCRILVPGEASLVILHFVNLVYYEEEATLVAELLATLALEG